MKRQTWVQAGILRATILMVLGDGGPLPWHKLFKRAVARQPGLNPVIDGYDRPEWTASVVRAQLSALKRRGSVEAIKEPGQGVLWRRTNKL